MTEDKSDDDPDWVQYQQNEIDEAAKQIKTRMEHIGSTVKDGMLKGEMIQEHQNERVQAYLEGYGDALSYAAARVKRIDNLVKYAVDDKDD